MTFSFSPSIYTICAQPKVHLSLCRYHRDWCDRNNQSNDWTSHWGYVWDQCTSRLPPFSLGLLFCYLFLPFKNIFSFLVTWCKWSHSIERFWNLWNEPLNFQILIDNSPLQLLHILLEISCMSFVLDEGNNFYFICLIILVTFLLDYVWILQGEVRY